MSQRLLIEEGGVPLHGTYELSADMQIGQLYLLAALAASEEVVINNFPDSPATNKLIELIRFLGGSVEKKGPNQVVVQPEELTTLAVPAGMLPDPEWGSLILSILCMRYGEAAVAGLTHPPDLSRLGIESSFQGDFLVGRIDYPVQPEPARLEYRLARPDNFVTASAVMAVVLRPGARVTLSNVAGGQLVNALIDIVSVMGGRVVRLSDHELEVEGVDRLSGGQITVPSSMDEAVVVATATTVTYGDVEIKSIDQEDLVSFLAKLQQIGVQYQLEGSGLRVWADKKSLFQPVHITTGWYPGFRSEWAGPMAVLLTQAQGESKIVEAIDQRELEFADLLRQSGAEVQPFEHTAGHDGKRGIKIFGPTKLTGQTLTFPPGYTCAVPLLIGLAADGTSELKAYEQFLTRYPYMLEKLIKLGAKIKLMEL